MALDEHLIIEPNDEHMIAIMIVIKDRVVNRDVEVDSSKKGRQL